MNEEQDGGNLSRAGQPLCTLLQLVQAARALERDRKNPRALHYSARVPRRGQREREKEKNPE